MRKVSIVSVLLLVVLGFTMFPIAFTADNSPALAEEGEAYFIVFGSWKLPKNVDSIIEECGGRIINKYPEVGVLSALPNGDPTLFEAMLSEQSGIIRFGRDYKIEVPDIPIEPELISAESLPPTVGDGFYWLYQWHLWHTIDASPDGAWSVTIGSPTIKVAILDTGIDYLHPDLDDNYDFANSRSFVDWDFDGIIDEPERDEHGHGSWCGGLVAAEINGFGTVGIGPELSLVNLKVMGAAGYGYFDWTFSAIYYAVSIGVDVVSMSFGGYVPFSQHFDPVYGGPALYVALERLFQYANKNGVVCVGSAGNDGLDMDIVHPWIHLPSQCQNVIAVTGTDIYNEICHTAWGSNYGSCLHGMAAPGGDLAFTRPEWYWTLPPGVWNPVYGACFSTDLYDEVGGIAWYGWRGGTSMAAPHVAGVAGLILSLNPMLSPAQVRYFLFNGAEDVGMPGYDEYTNYGIVNAYNSVEAVARSRIRGAVPW